MIGAELPPGGLATAQNVHAAGVLDGNSASPAAVHRLLDAEPADRRPPARPAEQARLVLLPDVAGVVDEADGIGGAGQVVPTAVSAHIDHGHRATILADFRRPGLTHGRQYESLRI